MTDARRASGATGLPFAARPLGAIFLGAALAAAIPSAAPAAAQDRSRATRFVIPGVAYDPDRGAPSAARAPSTDPDVPPVLLPKIAKPDAAPAQDRQLYEDPLFARDWRSTVGLTDGNQRCTATAIGPRVLLTAAHCVTRGTRMELADPAGPPIILACTRHPRYSPFGLGRFFDYALCHLSRDFPRRVPATTRYSLADLETALETHLASISPDDVKFMRHHVLHLIRGETERDDVLPFLERLARKDPPVQDNKGNAFDPTFMKERVGVALEMIRPRQTMEDVRLERLSLAPADGFFRPADPQARRLLMAGYGCTDRKQKRGNDGTLSIGIGIVTRFGPAWLTVGSGARRDSAIVCQGDSGGPAFRIMGPDPRGPRRLVAINAYNLRVAGALEGTSFVAKTASPAFVGFFAAWRRSVGNPRVCGLDPLPADICRI